MEQVDVVVVGGGVVGLATAAHLADEHEVFLLERRQYLGEEQSGRNSGVVHAGVYYEPASLKARLCVLGNRLMYKFCAEHGVPCARVGKFIVAASERQISDLLSLYRRAKRIGARGVHIVTPQELLAAEPNIHCHLALHFPSTGIVDAATLIRKLASLARQRNATILTSATVTRLQKHPKGVLLEVQYPQNRTEQVLARKVVNAAGLHSAQLARTLNPSIRFSISPVRGEYYSYIIRDEALRIRANIYPAPPIMRVGQQERFIVGIHLTPTFDLLPDGTYRLSRRVLVGPSATPTNDPTDFSPPRFPPQHFTDAVKAFFPQLTPQMLQPEYSGVQAKLSQFNDFAIFRDPSCPNCVHAIGVDSPGLTSCLAIAGYIARLLFP